MNLASGLTDFTPSANPYLYLYVACVWNDEIYPYKLSLGKAVPTITPKTYEPCASSNPKLVTFPLDAVVSITAYFVFGNLSAASLNGSAACQPIPIIKSYPSLDAASVFSSHAAVSVHSIDVF